MAQTATPQSAYIGLARRYRPRVFSELVGQEQIGHSLAQQVMQDRVGQAYIFSGPRGIGKTSAARILARCMNCTSSDGPTAKPCGECTQCRSIADGSNMDVIEIDAASNRGIDDIRDLQETISQNPFAARKKLYIIDEVHMLTREAFNALLKTLEEPPPFVIFVCATTEPERIPETIKSRCQSFQFKRIAMEDILRHLGHVADQESIEIDPKERQAVFEAIAYAVDGGMRDALMTLDQLAALSDGPIRLDETVRFLGVVEHDLLVRTVEMIHQRDTSGLLRMVHDLVEHGRDIERFVKNLLGFLRDLMVLKSGGGAELVNLPEDKLERSRALLERKEPGAGKVEVLSYPELLNLIQVFMNLEAEMKEAVHVRTHLEFALVKLTAIEPVVDISTLLRNLPKGGGGAAPRRPAPQTEGAPAAAKSESEAKSKTSTPDLFGGGSARREAVGIDGLWDALNQNRRALGTKMGLALKDCECLEAANDRLVLGLARKSLSWRALRDAAAVEKITQAASELAGRKIEVQVRPTDDSTAPRQSEKPDARAPVAREPEPEAPPVDDSPPLPDDYEDAVRAFREADPRSRTAQILREDPALREKVEMVRRFFDGRLLSVDGQEISL